MSDVAQIEALKAQIEALKAALQDARERIPEGEHWCQDCEQYAIDYACGCAECPECGERLPGGDKWFPELCDACKALEDADEAIAIAGDEGDEP